MRTTIKICRNALVVSFAGCALGGAALAGLSAPVNAASDACAASQIAKTIGAVGTSTGNYLDGHPETNAALTTIAAQPAGPQSVAAMKTYFDANPQAAKDMQQLQSPLAVLSSRCRLPIGLPQLMGLMSAAQTPTGSLPAGLPANAPTAQTLGAPATAGAVPAAQPPPPIGIVQGFGPLPGPVTTASR